MNITIGMFLLGVLVGAMIQNIVDVIVNKLIKKNKECIW